ncbi:hypothetical protein [Blastococcus sp. TF02A-30]|uniref:hypothetical protein n=1 Tax=Blastococcus sp. TF02A-30 TaxID=2250580 RepID=UPI000DEACA26|nr:hypothetical protein [Blastococcus sp. TF02A-30]RBY84938.1 hypothetical protein DQ241_16670 [Blastococcus sp. TF02A-30]
MAPENRHELVEAARVRGELTVSDLWLRYVALGGNGDLFDVDGYLNGLLQLNPFDQDVLATAVNERLEELYRSVRVPLSSPPARLPASRELSDVVAALLGSTGSRRTGPRAPSVDVAQPADPQLEPRREPDDSE